MWRGIYLSKLPGFERKVRVLFDWLLDMAFPRDIVVIRMAEPGDPPAPGDTARLDREASATWPSKAAS